MMPDTSRFYHAAYIAAVVLYGGYLASLWFRTRAARRRIEHGAPPS